jgi:hypothetical protein
MQLLSNQNENQMNMKLNILVMEDLFVKSYLTECFANFDHIEKWTFEVNRSSTLVELQCQI